MSAWLSTLHQTFIETGYWKQMLLGLQNTVIITLGALLIGVLVGLIGSFFSVNKYLRWKR